MTKFSFPFAINAPPNHSSLSSILSTRKKSSIQSSIRPICCTSIRAIQVKLFSSDRMVRRHTTELIRKHSQATSFSPFCMQGLTKVLVSFCETQDILRCEELAVCVLRRQESGRFPVNLLQCSQLSALCTP